MASSTKDLLARVLALPRDAREELAERILRSVDDDADEADVDAAWDREITDRLRRFDDGEERTTPWEQVRARLARDE